MDSCNVLEELHVGRLSSSDIFLAQQPVHEAYRCIAKQTQLRKLVFSGLEFTHGAFLQQVICTWNYVVFVFVFLEILIHFQGVSKLCPLGKSSYCWPV